MSAPLNLLNYLSANPLSAYSLLPNKDLPIMPAPNHIIAVDVGTTTIRACLYESGLRLNDEGREAPACERLASAAENVAVRYSGDAAEIEPEQLWLQFQRVVAAVVEQAPEGAKLSLAFCTQRNSFLTYNKQTMEPTSDIVCWNDKRSKQRCEDLNESFTLKCLHGIGALAHFFTRMPRFRAARMLQFISSMVSFRLMMAIQESKENQALLMEGNLGYACLDTWLLLKLSKGKYLATEPSNTSASGMYDPFTKAYNHIILRLFVGFPTELLVPIKDSAVSGAPHCTVDEDVFGVEMPVHAVLADQQAALFGCGGLGRGDTMISLGTGTFVQKNLAGRPHASMSGLYPLVAWKVDGRTTFIAEGQQHQSAVVLRWAQSMGLFDDVAESSAIAESVNSSEGVVFVPAMGGLQTPYNDDMASCAIFGIRAETTKAHQVRAILESLAFRVYEIFSTMEKEIVSKQRTSIRICGGISNNDFLCQTIATLIDRPVERIEESSFAAARGVALMAGVSLGAWTMDDVAGMAAIGKTFEPRSDRQPLMATFAHWQKVVTRALRFD